MATKTRVSGGEVTWYGKEVALLLEKATRVGLAQLAAEVDGLAKQNIVANGQVDTAFMLNSVYFVTHDESTYADDSGAHINNAGNFVERQMAPEAPLPDEYDALVCVGANYAIFQEEKQPFLYPALVQAQAIAGGVIEKAAQEAGT